MRKILIILLLFAWMGVRAQYPAFMPEFKVMNTKVDIQLHNAVNGAVVLLRGLTVEDDGQGGYFQWDATSITAPDGINVFAVTGVVTGRWLRMNIYPPGGGGSPNSNIGAGYRLAVPNTNNIKTLHAGTNITMDSVSNANEITITAAGASGITNTYAPLIHPNDTISQRYNVLHYGANPDGVYDSTAAITSGTNILTSAHSIFAAGDVGKKVVVMGAGTSGRDLATTIFGFTNATTVTLLVNASTTVSNSVLLFGTDNTTAIQNTINDCFLHGGGEVHIPNGIFIIAGSILGSAGQILIPKADSTFSDSLTHIKISGETPPHYTQWSPLINRNFNTYKGTVLVSFYAGGAGTHEGVIATTSNVNVFGSFNYTYLTVENLAIKVLDNPIGTGPTIGGINYHNGASLFCNNVTVTTIGKAQTSVLPSNIDIAAFETTDVNGETFSTLKNTYAAGFNQGYSIGEHTELDQAEAFVCYNGFYFKQGTHLIKGLSMGSYWCTNNIYFAGITNVSLQLDAELSYAAYSGGKWYDNRYTLNDSLNRGAGVLTYTVNREGESKNNSYFTQNGGTGISLGIDGQIDRLMNANYGINTQSPAFKLDVNGTSRFAGIARFDSGLNTNGTLLTSNQLLGVNNAGTDAEGKSLTVTAPITLTHSVGGLALSTLMNTGKLIGRYNAGTGVFEEITIGSNLALSGAGTLSASLTGAAVGNNGNIQYDSSGNFSASDNFVWAYPSGSSLTIRNPAVGATQIINGGNTYSVVGLALKDTVAATNGAQKFSPSLRFQGNGFATSGSRSQQINLSQQLRLIQGTTAPQWSLDFLYGQGIDTLDSYSAMTLSNATNQSATGVVLGVAAVTATNLTGTSSLTTPAIFFTGAAGLGMGQNYVGSKFMNTGAATTNNIDGLEIQRGGSYTAHNLFAVNRNAGANTSIPCSATNGSANLTGITNGSEFFKPNDSVAINTVGYRIATVSGTTATLTTTYAGTTGAKTIVAVSALTNSFGVGDNGIVRIGQGSWTTFGGAVNLPAGNLYLAPLYIQTGGALMTTPTANVIETDDADLYYTATSTRYKLDKSLSGSAALDFGSTGAGAIADLTITVTGAADGDVVELGVPNGSVTATATFTAWVSAANTVTVRFSPKATEDPASGTFKVRVIK